MSLEVLATGPLCTVQDLGRPALAGLGVTRSGAADRASLRLANRLLGNDEAAAALEVTLGGLRLRAVTPVVVAVTGAPCPGAPVDGVVRLEPGQVLALGTPTSGVRTYVAVAGGLAVRPVLGSRSTDTLAGLGPPVVAAGAVLPTGDPAALPDVEVAPRPVPAADDVLLHVHRGPRLDRLDDAAWDALTGTAWTVAADSDRVGVRLDGAALRAREGVGELASEGLLRGAVQVPPSGRPVVFLADHPVTGGYPVVAYVDDAEPGPWRAGTDVDRLAQVRPGQVVRLAAVTPTPPAPHGAGRR
ncbi:5-oxoprolinase/urea amidolyase family protein [Aquipuribacter nitratireducens]|uniref:Biotin-dependent carboxyltransferase family protein n=1 Tax=Aquipuribacter nitratireducens TaxID=650104 RepID=A0ABW0GSD4_9MICO